MFDFKEFYDWAAAVVPNDCKLVEVGAATGDSGIYLAKKLKELGKNFTLYLVDDMSYGGMDQLNDLWRNVADSGLHKNIQIIPKDSREAAKMFNGNSVHMVFLDSSHQYQETKESLIAWYYPLTHEGIMGGHDYDLYPEVKKAVNEIVPEFSLRDPIPDQQSFAPVKILHTMGTENKYGLYYFIKRFWLNLNTVNNE